MVKMHLTQYPQMGCAVVQTMLENIKCQCSKALPAHVSRDLHRSTGAGKKQPCTLQQVSRVSCICMSTVKPQKLQQSQLRNVYGSDSEREVLTATRAGLKGLIQGEQLKAILRVYHSKEKQGKYSQSIILTGILCCRAKQYSHLRRVRYSCRKMANEWSDHSLFLQPGNCRTA